MAEFQKIMNQWRRFCRSHRNCGECEFDGNGICGEAHLSDVPYADIEIRIMAWAAEHPEPVYPTWGEWLKNIGIIRGVAFLANTGLDTDIYFGDFDKSIPADTAQKLGLEPKDG